MWKSCIIRVGSWFVSWAEWYLVIFTRLVLKAFCMRYVNAKMLDAYFGAD